MTEIVSAAVAADQDFVEIPLRHGALADLLLSPRIERMPLIADHICFRSHGEGHAIVQRAELLDLFG